MPDLRKDPVSGRWVIIAAERARRPSDDLLAARDAPFEGICPFCPGHEEKTPPEVLAYRPFDGPGARANAPGWTLRVFPNRYPALKIEGSIDRQGEGLYDRMNGVGAHEVVVETPDHQRALADLLPSEMEYLCGAWCDRIHDLKRDTRFRYVMLFKNHRAAAGATLPHAHSQLIALPMVPKVVEDELTVARAYYDFKERCVLCDIVHQELRDGRRVVYENAEFLVAAPWAPRFPFETWILPKRHRPSYETQPRAEYALLADALGVTLRKLRDGLGDPPYSFILHTSPLPDEESPHYHWHFEIMPKLTQVAGFEWGSGFYINPTAPEEAARFLRELPDK